MKKIAIIGHGYVGQAMERFFNRHYEVVIYDIKYFTGEAPDFVVNSDEHVKYLFSQDVQANRAEANLCDFAVICVPTAMMEDGNVDTSLVAEQCTWLTVPLVLIKSTIPPGTTGTLQAENPSQEIVFSPEYIGEGKYMIPWWHDMPHATDMKYHNFQIFGGRPLGTQQAIDFFTPVLGPTVTYTQTDSMTAEFVKYMENIWGAMKVTWANEMYECARKVGIDYRVARELWGLDKRVEKMHTVVFPEKRGWAGKCYPKDLMGFIKLIQTSGYEPETLKEIVRSNARFSTDPAMQALPDKL